MRLALVFALWLISIASHATAETTQPILSPEDFAYGFVLPNHAAGAHDVVLPREVYALLTRSDRRDLAVFDADGQLVPYIVYSPGAEAPERVTRGLACFRLPTLTEGPNQELAVYVRRDNSGAVVNVTMPERAQARDHQEQATPSEWLFDLGSEPSEEPVSLTLRWSESPRDFLSTLTLRASDDLVHWAPVASASVVQLRVADKRVESQPISLHSLLRSRARERASTSARYLRVTLDARVPPELTLLGADLSSERAPRFPQPAQVELPGTPESEPLSFRFRLPGPLPALRARVVFAEDNTLVEGVLEAAADSDGPFTARYEGALRRLEGEAEAAWITLMPEDRELRLVLHDRGSARSAKPAVWVEYVPAQLQFLARNGQPHLLAVGSARRIGEPVHSGLPVSGKAEVLSLDLTARRELGGPTRLSPEPVLEPTPWNRYVLIAALLLGTGLFAALAMRLLRDMRKAS